MALTTPIKKVVAPVVSAAKTAVAATKTPVIQGTVTSTTSANGVTTPVTAGAVKSPVTTSVTPAYKAPTAAPNTTPTTAPTTSYVANGGQTLNDILSYKKSYESGKTGVAAYAANSYKNLAPELATNVKGMNAAQLEAYIMGKSGQGNTTDSNTPTTAVDYNALAQAEYDRQLAAMMAGAQSQETELNRRYAYANGVTKDDRTLRDASFYRNNAPTSWDGQSLNKLDMTYRQDGIDDHYTKEALTDSTAAAYSQANAFKNQSGNFMSTEANKLQTAAQQSARDDAALTGYYNGQQTMQGASNAANIQGQQLSNAGQQIANQIAQMDLSTYPQEKQLKIKQLQQQVASGAISNQTAQYQLGEMTNPNSVTNQVAALELQMKQTDASTYSQENQLKLQQLQKTVAEIGKKPYVSEVDSQLDQLKLQTAQLEYQKLTNPSTLSVKAEEYAAYIDKSVQYDSDGAITNLDAVKNQILAAGLDDTETAKLYSRYGIPLPAGYSGN